MTSPLSNNLDIFTSCSSGIVTARQKGPGKHGVRFFSPKITFAVKAGNGGIDEVGEARASKSVLLWVGLGENNNGQNSFGFGVLGVGHGGMSGKEISFNSSPRGPRC